MPNPESVSGLVDHDDNVRFILKPMLDASMEASFNGVMITGAKEGYPLGYAAPRDSGK